MQGNPAAGHGVVIDMDHIALFRECYERWAGWIGLDGDQLQKNTIWHQCTEMMNNEFIFQALFLAGRRAALQPDFSSFLAANRPLYRYLLDGYLSYQYLAIRRLTDPTSKRDDELLRGVMSVRRLLDDMKQHAASITREAFVCVNGLPYAYEALLVREKEAWLARVMESPGPVWGGEGGAGAQSAHRHLMFDHLSGVLPEQRKPTDTVSPTYWKRCRKMLNEPDLTRIRRFVNKYIAHPADVPSLATLDEEDKKLSMKRIHNAQGVLIALVQQLTSDFYYAKLPMISVYGEAELVHNFSQPFVSEEIAREVYKEIQQRVQERLSGL